MGTREMPKVADFLTILPVTPELVLEIGYLPQCTWGDRGPKFHCGLQSEWTINGDHYCNLHKILSVKMWEEWIEGWVARPAEAQDSDLKLLEIIRSELQPRSIDFDSRFVLDQVIRELSLPDTAKGRNLAAWYLWEMRIFSIDHRTAYYEQS